LVNLPITQPTRTIKDLQISPRDHRNLGFSKTAIDSSVQFKFRLALDAAKGLRTVNELASEHGLHPNQISQWKRHLIEKGTSFFTAASERQQRQQEAIEAELFEQIGRLKMELEWLKKSYSIYLRSK
jgi:transposase-like protein